MVENVKDKMQDKIDMCLIDCISKIWSTRCVNKLRNHINLEVNG